MKPYAAVSVHAGAVPVEPRRKATTMALSDVVDAGRPFPMSHRSGATPPFTSIEDFPFERYRRRGRGKAIAEVAVEYAVRDLAEIVTGRWRAQRDVWEPM